jgi:hypothetical protein
VKTAHGDESGEAEADGNWRGFQRKKKEELKRSGQVKRSRSRSKIVKVEVRSQARR